MATKTWALKVGQFGTVQVKGLKKEVEHLFYSGFSPILKIQNYATEINGIIGGEEHKHTYMSMFTPSGGHVDVEAWQEDMTELFKGLPTPIVDLSGTLTRCRELFTKHCPVIDKRKTQEQVDAENAEYLEGKAANTWIAWNGDCGQADIGADVQISSATRLEKFFELSHYRFRIRASHAIFRKYAIVIPRTRNDTAVAGHTNLNDFQFGKEPQNNFPIIKTIEARIQHGIPDTPWGTKNQLPDDCLRKLFHGTQLPALPVSRN